MIQSSDSRRGRRARDRTMALSVFLMITLVSVAAFAGNLRYSGSHTTSKSPEEVWAVLSAYDQMCDTGCKYPRDNLVVVKKVQYRATANSWYTWTHVTNPLKEVTYFTRVSVKFDAAGNLVADNRQLDSSHKAMISALEKHTGLKHSPAFDRGNTKTVTESMAGGKTKVTRVITLTASGFLALWEGKVLRQMKKGMQRTFQNIDK